MHLPGGDDALAGDEDRVHGAGVPAHQTLEAAEPLHGRLVDFVHAGVEALGVEHHHVGALAHLERAGVDLEPLAELSRQPPDGLPEGHHGGAGVGALPDELQHAEREVVEAHVPQVRAGVREADEALGPRQHAGEGARAVVARHRVPAERLAVLGDEVEEGVLGPGPAALRHLGEGAPHERGLRARLDARVGEVPVEDLRQEGVPPLAAKAAAVARVPEEPAPLDLRLEVHALRAGPELLEERVVEAVGPEVEGHGEELEAEARAQEPVEGEAERPEQPPDHPVRAQVHHGEHARLQCPAREAHAQRPVEEDLVLRRNVRQHLEMQAAPAHEARHAPNLGPARVRRGQAMAPEAVAAHLVPGEAVDREAEKARLEPLLHARLHALQLVRGQPRLPVEGPLEAEHLRAHRRVPDEGRHVRPQRQRVEVRRVLGVRRPGLPAAKEREEVLVGDRLDAREHVRDVRGVAHRRAQRAAPHEHRGDAVAQGLVEGRVELDLPVVMRVDVDEAGRHPAPLGLDHRVPGSGLQRRLRDRRHPPVLEAEVAHGGRPPTAIEEEAVPDDGGGHGRTRVYHARRAASGVP